MKITKKQLTKIIKEESQKLLKEGEAESALQHYAASIGAEEEDLETVAVDLITDILQLLREKGINTDSVLSSAQGHINAEHEGI